MHSLTFSHHYAKVCHVVIHNNPFQTWREGTKIKKWHIIALSVLLCFVLGGCGTKTNETEPWTQQGTQTPETQTPETEKKETLPLEESIKNTIQATITMEDGGKIVLELYPDLAPQSVRNFVYLARQGFYDGLTFHRIMKGFMIQGGDPAGNGSGGPDYSIKGEFRQNGFENDLQHKRGILSMARSQNYNSAGSQFFIMHADNTSLDGSYAAFGQVTGGMDVVDQIADTPNSGPNGLVAEENKPVIKTITIDDKTDLPEPDKL
jgi:peptidyl-prolyl cis-trans isomerase B (cyclophilin B)